MTTKPTTADLAAWMKIPTTPALTVEKTAQLQLCLDAAWDDIDERCDLPATLNGKVKLAWLILAARYSKRSDSPEGVAGFGDLGVVRVQPFDRDVERLISRYVRIEFA